MDTRVLAAVALVACTDLPPEVEPDPCASGATLSPPQVVTVGQPADLGISMPAGCTGTLTVGEVTVESVDGAYRHSFAEPGRFSLALEVGELVVGARVAATDPVLSTPPSASSTVALAGGRAFVAAVDLGHVAVVDTGTWSLLETLPLCVSPARVAARGDLLAVLCGEGGGELVLLSVSSLEVQARVDLDGLPTGVVLTDGSVVVSSRVREDDEGRVQVFTWQGAPVSTTRRGTDLRGLAWADGRLAASRFRSPDKAGEVWLDDTRLELAPNLGPDSDTSSRGVPNLLEALAFSPGGRSLAVGGLRANMARGLARDGLPLTHDSTARATLRLVDLQGEELGRGRLDNRDLVSAVAWSPAGDWLYIAYLGMRAIETLDPFNMALSGSLMSVGDGIDGLAVSADGRWLYAHARYSRALVRVPVDGAELGLGESLSLLGDAGEPWEPARLRGAVVFHDASNRAMSRDGYASCGSCHPHGEDDGRTWDFTDRGEGLRNTPTLRGMAGRVGGPIHWSGNFDEVQDFEADMRLHQAGTGFLEESDWDLVGPSLGASKGGLSGELDDMAAYVEALETLDVPASPHPEGEAVFLAAGCADCHPDGGTDSRWIEPGVPLLHDVGTRTDDSGMRLGGPLEGLDTPDLRGSWGTAPYLHDGRATTLRDVLDDNVGDAHGRTSTLSEGEREALVRYLRTL